MTRHLAKRKQAQRHHSVRVQRQEHLAKARAERIAWAKRVDARAFRKWLASLI